MAERFPENLDDEIKKVHEAFYVSSQKLEPEQLKDMLPTSLPMTHIYEDDGTKHYGIARHPIDEWMALGEPVITVRHW
eukprot:12888620-Prorocentrum_lima.AAC.1